jgi:L-2-hydroxyglutarate oxidase LhgO
MGAQVDIAIIGGGIVGLATALALTEARPGSSIAIVEKEDGLGRHQSSRNSGVIHAGVYYKPGSLKAELCREGRRQLMAFCDEHRVQYDVCGKVIVATQPEELPRLEELARRSAANGVEARPIGLEELHELEPHAAGMRGLQIPSTGVVDFGQVVAAMGDELRRRGVDVRLRWPVEGVQESTDAITLSGPAGSVQAGRAVNCAGLFVDRVRRLVDPEADGPFIVPFRGEYYELVPERSFLCRTLIYPVPDPAFPFLGVHLTRGIEGHVHVGPNAVPALRREGYRWRDVSLAELGGTVAQKGSRVLAKRYWRTGAAEIWRSASKRAFTKAAQRMCPDVRMEDLVRAPAGVRAQALDPTGELLDDFAFARTDRMLHVLNCPSPAATASLAIGRHIASELV